MCRMLLRYRLESEFADCTRPFAVPTYGMPETTITWSPAGVPLRFTKKRYDTVSCPITICTCCCMYDRPSYREESAGFAHLASMILALDYATRIGASPL